MKVNLIFFLIITILKKINLAEYNFNLENNTIIEYNYIVKISTFMNESIVNYSKIYEKYNFTEKEYKNYFYLKFYESKIEENNTVTFLNDINFTLANITYSYLNHDIFYILSLNNVSHSLIIIDYNQSKLILDNETFDDRYEVLFKNENICYNESLDVRENIKFICKLDYILLGHEDLKKDDVYLAKEIKPENSKAYLDNFLSYNIFPEEYLQYFLTSFFSELNDECQKNECKLEDNENIFYYITCPKKKIDIYTKRRKLSVIINKFSYVITDLFKDSLDFLTKNDKDDNYYFNIVFQKVKYFTLGIGFFKNIKLGYYNECTYIYSEDRHDYTKDLTDMDSDQFEKWLYILTICSFTFLLLIFTTIGCFHTRKVNKELKEMLK